MKTLKSLTALSLGALCLAFNTQVIAKEATPTKASQSTQQVAKLGVFLVYRKENNCSTIQLLKSPHCVG